MLNFYFLNQIRLYLRSIIIMMKMCSQQTRWPAFSLVYYLAKTRTIKNRQKQIISKKQMKHIYPQKFQAAKRNNFSHMYLRNFKGKISSQAWEKSSRKLSLLSKPKKRKRNA